MTGDAPDRRRATSSSSRVISASNVAMYGDIAPVRSMPSVSIATFQPPFTSPTTRSAGARASSKNTSQNSSPPAMFRIGRTSTPGWCASTSSIVMPRCRLSSVPVRHSTYIQSAKFPSVIQIFWPLMTHASPSGSARAQGREVGAGVGLAEALAPELVGAHDRREETLLLLVGAVQQQRRTEQVPPVHTDPERRAGARVLDLEDDLLCGSPAAAAVLLGPRHVEPPSRRRALVPTRGARPSARRRSGCPHRDARGTRRRGDRGATRAARRGTLRLRGSARGPPLLRRDHETRHLIIPGRLFASAVRGN